jgi:hypothetical protein
MAIEMKLCPVVDGKAYATVREAQKQELVDLFTLHVEENTTYTPAQVAEMILNSPDVFLAILQPEITDAPAAPKKPRKVTVRAAWDQVNWTLNDKSIAKEWNVAWGTVKRQRKKLFAPTGETAAVAS